MTNIFLAAHRLLAAATMAGVWMFSVWPLLVAANTLAMLSDLAFFAADEVLNVSYHLTWKLMNWLHWMIGEGPAERPERRPIPCACKRRVK